MPSPLVHGRLGWFFALVGVCLLMVLWQSTGLSPSSTVTAPSEARQIDSTHAHYRSQRPSAQAKDGAEAPYESDVTELPEAQRAQSQSEEATSQTQAGWNTFASFASSATATLSLEQPPRGQDPAPQEQPQEESEQEFEFNSEPRAGGQPEIILPPPPLDQPPAKPLETTVCAIRDRTLQLGLEFSSEEMDVTRMFVETTPWRTLQEYDAQSRSWPLCPSNQVHGTSWPFRNSMPAEVIRALNLDPPPDQRDVDQAIAAGQPAWSVQDVSAASTLPPNLRLARSGLLDIERKFMMLERHKAQEGRVMIECPVSSCAELQRLDRNMSRCNWDTLRWHTPGCRSADFVRSPSAVARCLTERNLVFIGDSTIRGQSTRIAELLGFPIDRNATPVDTPVYRFERLELTPTMMHSAPDAKLDPTSPYSLYHVYWPPKGPNRFPTLNATIWASALESQMSEAVYALVNKSIEWVTGDAGRNINLAPILRPTTFVLFGLFAEPWLVDLSFRHLSSAYARSQMFFDEIVNALPATPTAPQNRALQALLDKMSKWKTRSVKDQPELGALPRHVSAIIGSKRPRRDHAMIIHFASWEASIREATARVGFLYVDQFTTGLTLWGRVNKPDLCRCHFIPTPLSSAINSVNDLLVDQLLNVACEPYRE